MLLVVAEAEEEQHRSDLVSKVSKSMYCRDLKLTAPNSVALPGQSIVLRASPRVGLLAAWMKSVRGVGKLG